MFYDANAYNNTEIGLCRSVIDLGFGNSSTCGNRGRFGRWKTLPEADRGRPAADHGRGTAGDQAALIYRAVCLKERRLCRNDRTRLRGTGGSELGGDRSDGRRLAPLCGAHGRGPPV
jgi:hypothetical protein